MTSDCLSMFLEQQIIILMISERSCDTEDWSNENAALITEINYSLKYINIKNSFIKLQKHFTILLILLYF